MIAAIENKLSDVRAIGMPTNKAENSVRFCTVFQNSLCQHSYYHKFVSYAFK